MSNKAKLCVTILIALLTGMVFYSTVTLLEKNDKLTNDNRTLQTEIRKFRVNLDKAKKDIEKYKKIINDLKNRLKSETDTNKNLNRELDDSNKQLKKYKDRIRILEKEVSMKKEREKSLASSSSVSIQDVIYMQATAYVANCSEGCSGTTATGYDLSRNPNAKIIAVDTSIIPLGTKVYVEGYGYATASDTGGAIKGYKIDLNMPSVSDAISWGSRHVKVSILR